MSKPSPVEQPRSIEETPIGKLLVGLLPHEQLFQASRVWKRLDVWETRLRDGWHPLPFELAYGCPVCQSQLKALFRREGFLLVCARCDLAVNNVWVLSTGRPAAGLMMPVYLFLRNLDLTYEEFKRQVDEIAQDIPGYIEKRSKL